jgi:hypothetical protein
LQASAYLQLRVMLPPDEVAAVLAKYRPKAVATYRGGIGAGALGFPTSLFYTSERAQNEPDGSGAEPFPDRYLILYLGPCDPAAEEEAREAQGHPEGTVRARAARPVGYGLAIDLAACEVVYWAQGG